MGFLKLFYKKNTSPTHAGSVMYREVNGTKEYLLVSAKRFRFIWVLPKGHIKKSETEEHAALRELLEESGMNAVIVKVNMVRKIVYPLEKAISKLFYRDQKKILKQLRS